MKRILLDTWLLLTFRLPAEAFSAFTPGHLVFGLLSTWIVGMGRYWDTPDALTVQHLGLGSVAYVVVLSALLWAIAKPLARGQDWSYVRVLTYVTLVSPPAALYAIPVERFMDLPSAQSANGWFLTLVAAWRVALLVRLYRVHADLNHRDTTILTLLPLSGIVLALSALNLERAVFNIMASLGESTSNDGAYFIVLALSWLSMPVAPLCLIAYIMAVVHRRRERRA